MLQECCVDQFIDEDFYPAIIPRLEDKRRTSIFWECLYHFTRKLFHFSKIGPGPLELNSYEFSDACVYDIDCCFPLFLHDKVFLWLVFVFLLIHIFYEKAIKSLDFRKRNSIYSTTESEY